MTTTEIKNILKRVATKEISKNEAITIINTIKKQMGNPNRQIHYENQKKFTRTFVFDEPLLKDHTVFDKQVLLGVTHCSLAIEASKILFPGQKMNHIHKLLFEEPIILQPKEIVDVKIFIENNGDKVCFKNKFFKHFSPDFSNSDMAVTASGEFLFGSEKKSDKASILELRNYKIKSFDKDDVYKKMRMTPIHHGPSLQTVKTVDIFNTEALSELSLSDEIITSGYAYDVHPAIMDGAIVSSIVAFSGDSIDSFVPLMIKDIYIHHSLPANCLCHSKLVKKNSELFSVDLTIMDNEGKTLLELNEFTCKRVKATSSFDRKSDSVLSTVLNKRGQIEKGMKAKPSKSDTTHHTDKNIKKMIEEYLIEKVNFVTGDNFRLADYKKNFMELGVDSAKLISLTQQIENELDIELYPTLFFEYQNIPELTEYFFEKYKENFIEKHKMICTDNTSEVVPRYESNHAPDNEIAFHKNITVSDNFPVKNADNSNLDDGDLLHSDDRNKKMSADDVAIIGMAGYFADSADLSTLWNNIMGGKNLITEIPLDHFDYRPWYDPDGLKSGTMYCKWGSFVQDIDKFDAKFFNISPREAEMMDPQLRYLLQVLYATSDDAGYSAIIRGSRTGMFVGACFHDYMHEIGLTGKDVSPYEGTGNAATMLANRPSFYFNIHGPSLLIDTACSSSLCALHVARKALLADECEMAFVAGVNFLLSSWHYRYFCTIGALSHSGRCHSFDSRADGYVPGEGVGAVLLKPLNKALADRDNIHAVIKGSAVNHGGYTPSITAPSVKLESQVIIDAWKNAKIDPATIGYIEGHGTGTKLGDPIEIQAIDRAFKEFGVENPNCFLGSAKAHIGHTEGAAGIAGIIKAVLSLKNKQIPSMPMLNELNPYINEGKTAVSINRQIQHWQKPVDAPRRAGISSFGFGGAYAHVVVEEYENQNNLLLDEGLHIIVLSAQTEDALKNYAEKLRQFLHEKSVGIRSNQNNIIDGIKKELRNFAADIRKVSIKDIDINENLQDQGFDMIDLLQYANRINEKYNLKISSDFFSDSMNIISISQNLFTAYKEYFCKGDGDGKKASEIEYVPEKMANVRLRDIAYTLQTGREEMSWRLAVVISNVKELCEELENYLCSKHTSKLYKGNIESLNEKSLNILSGVEGQNYFNDLIDNRKLEKLAQLWVLGIKIEWNLLYQNELPLKISLPSYPFEKKSYWFAQVTSEKKGATKFVEKPVHIKPNHERENNNQKETEDNHADVSITSIQSFLLHELSVLRHMDKTEIHPATRFEDLGIDSINIAELSEAIGEKLKIGIRPNRLFDYCFDYPTVSDLAEYLSTLIPRQSEDNHAFEDKPDQFVESSIGDKAIYVVGDNFANFCEYDGVVNYSNLIRNIRKNPSDINNIIIGQGLNNQRIDTIKQLKKNSEIRNNDKHKAIVDKKVVHKHKEKNVLITIPEKTGKDEYSAFLIINDKCMEMSDHITGKHVQGTVLIEAARQMMMAVFEMNVLNENQRGSYAYTLDEFHIRNIAYIFPIDTEIRLFFVEKPWGRRGSLRTTVKIEFIQMEKVKCEVRCAASAYPTSMLKQVEDREAFKAYCYLKDKFFSGYEEVA